MKEKKQRRFHINNDGVADRSDQRNEITEYYSCEVCGAGHNRALITVAAHYSEDHFNIERCEKCGLIFVNPRLNSDFRKFCYEKETHLLDWFLQMEKERSRIATSIMDALAEMGLAKGRLLELGCGVGTFLDKAKERGFHVTGVELNQKTAHYAAQRHNVIQQDLYDVSLPSAGFDVVVMDQTLEHLGEPLKALKKIRELLKPGGCLLVGVPRVDWLVLLRDRLTNPSKKSNFLWSPDDHLFYFTHRSIRTILLTAGFQNTRLNTHLRWRIKEFLFLSSGYFMAIKK